MLVSLGAIAMRSSADGECALVGTSGTLLTRRQGAEIDAAVHVFRLGLAPIGDHWAPFVGRRTTARFIKQSVMVSGAHRVNKTLAAMVLRELASQGQAGRCEEQPEVWYSQGSLGVCVERLLKGFHVHYAQAALLPIRCVPTTLMCLPPRGRPTPPRKPTSGMIALGLLHALAPRCMSVRLYGFGTSGGDDAPYHYWSDGTELDGVRARSHYDAEANGVGHSFGAEVCRSPTCECPAGERSPLRASPPSALTQYARLSPAPTAPLHPRRTRPWQLADRACHV